MSPFRALSRAEEPVAVVTAPGLVYPVMCPGLVPKMWTSLISPWRTASALRSPRCNASPSVMVLPRMTARALALHDAALIGNQGRGSWRWRG